MEKHFEENKSDLVCGLAEQFHFPNWRSDWNLILKQDSAFGKLSFFTTAIDPQNEVSESDSEEEEKQV